MKSVVAASLIAGAFALDSNHVDPLPGWDFICNGELSGDQPGRRGLGIANTPWQLPFLGEVGCMQACENQAAAPEQSWPQQGGRCNFVHYDTLNGDCWMEISSYKPTECQMHSTTSVSYWTKPQDDVVALNAVASPIAGALAFDSGFPRGCLFNPFAMNNDGSSRGCPCEDMSMDHGLSIEQAATCCQRFSPAEQKEAFPCQHGAAVSV